MPPGVFSPCELAPDSSLENATTGAVARADRLLTVRAKARASTNIMDKIFFMFFLLDAPAPGADGDER